jgi:hypothetical protein
MAEMFSISWSPESLKQIAQLVGMAGMLSPVIQQALSKGGDAIVETAVANTWERFRNPSGELASSIHKLEQSPFELLVGSDDPKAHRREFSFKGPDALGRMFPNDPAAFYLTDAMSMRQDDILELLQQGVQTLLESGGGS